MSKCPDCEEYNHEKHYCPKFCDVIREITNEMQDFYKGEHEKLERIEQIVEDYDGSAVSMVKQFSEIQEILEQE